MNLNYLMPKNFYVNIWGLKAIQNFVYMQKFVENRLLT